MIQTRTLIVSFISALLLALLVAYLYLTFSRRPAEPYRPPAPTRRG